MGPKGTGWKSTKLGGHDRSHSFSHATPDSAHYLIRQTLSRSKVSVESFQHPGFGRHYKVDVPAAPLELIEGQAKPKHLLGEWMSTAICANDILSSVIYTSGLVSATAGVLAPVCLFIVAAVLHLFKSIYCEAISALPSNGGSYNVLLNATSKSVAALAACVTVLSYVTTGVVSAASAIAYLHVVFPQVHLVYGTVLLLLFFACLTAFGVSESARVAVGIFALHVLTLTAVCLLSSVYVAFNSATLHGNIEAGYPDVILAGGRVGGTVWTALLFGVSTAFLGVSGFETSAQFVEEQAAGVFPKTLSNMWFGVTVFNPLLCVLSLGVLDIDEVVTFKDSVLAHVVRRVGNWLQMELLGVHGGGAHLGSLLMTWVSIDAFIVLSGAVLTAYVGITGLVRTMARDRCLPQFLLATNRNGSCHNIIFGYFLLGSSLVLLMGGDIEVLGNIYTMAFLCVMIAFAVGVVLLQAKRLKLPRDITTPPLTLALALLAVGTSLVVNVAFKPEILVYFLLYLGCVLALVGLMFERVRLLKLLAHVVDKWSPRSRLAAWVQLEVQRVLDVPCVFFCKRDDLYVLNKAALYVRNNEQTQRLLIVHATSNPFSDTITGLSEHATVLCAMYPKLSSSLVTLTFPPGHETFSGALIEWFCQEWDVPRNMCFVTCSNSVKVRISELGGVRVITH